MCPADYHALALKGLEIFADLCAALDDIVFDYQFTVGLNPRYILDKSRNKIPLGLDHGIFSDYVAHGQAAVRDQTGVVDWIVNVYVSNTSHLKTW